jgi:hypothetical protein
MKVIIQFQLLIGGGLYFLEDSRRTVGAATSSGSILKHKLIYTIAGNFGDQTAHYGSIDGLRGTSAHLINPWDVKISGGNKVYIADGGRILEMDPSTSTLMTVAGNATGGYSSTTGDYSGPATLAQLSSPLAIACGSLGDLYISDNI